MEGLEITPQQSHEEWAREETERRRRAAYSDPNTGSDRHFSEAARLRAVGEDDAADEAQAKGIARAEEIKQTFPYFDELT